MKQEAGSGFEHSRHAVGTSTRSIVAAEDGAHGTVLHKTGNEEIESPVVIIIKPGRACGPVRRSNTSLLGHVCERPVTIVTKQNVATVVGHVQVLPTVSIEVGCRGAHPEMTHLTAGDPGLFGDVSERSGVVISVESVSDGGLRRIKVGRAAVDKVDIHPPVVVEIKEQPATAAGLG